MVRVRFTMSGHVNGRLVSEVHYIECERYQLVGHQDITVDDDHICEWEEIESRIFIDSNDIERVDYVEVPARDEESLAMGDAGPVPEPELPAAQRLTQMNYLAQQILSGQPSLDASLAGGWLTDYVT